MAIFLLDPESLRLTLNRAQRRRWIASPRLLDTHPTLFPLVSRWHFAGRDAARQEASASRSDSPCLNNRSEAGPLLRASVESQRKHRTSSVLAPVVAAFPRREHTQPALLSLSLLKLSTQAKKKKWLKNQNELPKLLRNVKHSGTSQMQFSQAPKCKAAAAVLSLGSIQSFTTHEY